jgi:hypothetical protein
MTNAGESHNATNAAMLPLFIASMASFTVLITSLEGDAAQIAGENAKTAVRTKAANRWILMLTPLEAATTQPYSREVFGKAGSLAFSRE